MDTTLSFLSDSTHFFDFPISVVRRGTPDDVMDELAKLEKVDPEEKSDGQTAAEVIAEIDSLHEESYMVIESGHKRGHNKCAECWTPWPCATHRAIYGETKDNCVHRI